MYVLVKILFLIAIRPIFGKVTALRLSACSVLIVVPLLLVRPSFPLVSWTESVGQLYRFLIMAFLSIYSVFHCFTDEVNDPYDQTPPFQ